MLKRVKNEATKELFNSVRHPELDSGPQKDFIRFRLKLK